MAYSNPRESVFNQPKPVVHLPQDLLDAIAEGAAPYPVPAGRKYEYGTAGVSEPARTIRLSLRLLTVCLLWVQFRMKAYVTLQPHRANTAAFPPDHHLLLPC